MDAEQATKIVSLVRAVLGSDAVGAYLHGSAVLSRLRPRSDIDVFVVSRRPTTATEKRTLIDGLLPISGRGDPTGRSRPIELAIAVQSEVRPWHYPPTIDFLYGDWMRAEFERGELTPWETPNPDIAPLLTMVLMGNRPLFGPPPAEVLDPVPHEDVVRAVLAGIPGLLADLEGDEANVVLTFARIWVTLATGAILAKDAAADWALERLPVEHRPVLARARSVYLGSDDDRWDDLRPAIRPHVDHVLGQIGRLAAP